MPRRNPHCEYIETRNFSKVPNGAGELGFQLRCRCESPWVAKSKGKLPPQTHPGKKNALCFVGKEKVHKLNQIENTRIWQIFN